MTRYHVVPIEEPKKAQISTQWSLGLAMFAAFVIPFVLLTTSARYRGFVVQAKNRIEHVSRSTTGGIYTGAGAQRSIEKNHAQDLKKRSP